MKRNIAIVALIIVVLTLLIIIVAKPEKIKLVPVEVTKEVEVEKEVIVEVEKEVIVEKETIVEKEVTVEVEVEPTYVYNVTSAEREMLARLVYLEGGIESLECQKAIASVVINRWQNGYWGDTIKKVIYAKAQFSPASKIKTTTPTETQYEAVDYVLKNGCTLPEYVLYFRANYHHKWTGYQPYTVIGRTYFGYLEKDKK
jgi:spore germination cell wall hydrolase CwlJ-like protein